MIDKKKVLAFVAELSVLCEKHGLVAVPSYQGEPSAHDPMHVIPLDEFWRGYLAERVFICPTLDPETLADLHKATAPFPPPL